jgi:hypothetical protein
MLGVPSWTVWKQGKSVEKRGGKRSKVEKSGDRGKVWGWNKVGKWKTEHRKENQSRGMKNEEEGQKQEERDENRSREMRDNLGCITRVGRSLRAFNELMEQQRGFLVNTNIRSEELLWYMHACLYM